MNSDVEIGKNHLRISRVFSARRPRVFSWWTVPEKLQRWSGCEGATSCKITMEFREGGSFTQTMQIAGRGEFSFTGTYTKIIEPERIEYTADFGHAITQVTVEFVEQEDRTKVILTYDGLPEGPIAKFLSFGTTDSLNKLERIVNEEC